MPTRPRLSGLIPLVLGLSACHETIEVRATSTACGDARLDPGEACDDGNIKDGDGCSSKCEAEAGWSCAAEREGVCAPVCGDGLIRGAETCDDGNVSGSDGCTSVCLVRAGWACAGEPSVCLAVCGDGLLLGQEACDDGNRTEADGCDAQCRIEPGFRCDQGECSAICGDGRIVGDERCDDGNLEPHDGCSPSCTDSRRWRALSSLSTSRAAHFAGWTGSELLLWGGNHGGGAVHDPRTGGWRAMSSRGEPRAPKAAAVLAAGTLYTSSARYDLLTDTWIRFPTEGAPAPRTYETVAFNGRELFVFGGRIESPVNVIALAGDAAIFDVVTQRWRAVSPLGMPSPRAGATAVWTEGVFLVFGGGNVFEGFEDGARYDPAVDAWRPIASLDAPFAREMERTVVWTGSELIAWFPTVAAGARYDPRGDAWVLLPSDGAPSPRYGSAMLWAGSEVLVWGGVSADRSQAMTNGARFVPALNQWRPMTSLGAPEAGLDQGFAWTGREAVVSGGLPADYSHYLNAVGAYDPREDTWRVIPVQETPTARAFHPTVWTGTEMVTWGGLPMTQSRVGGRFDPRQNVWRPMTLDGAPNGRHDHSAVWTGDRLIIWGGIEETPVTGGFSAGASNTGAAYDPRTDTWTPLSVLGAPSARAGHFAEWTGEEMIVFGSFYETDELGALYDPGADVWRPISVDGAPAQRANAAHAWTGTELLLFGGCCSDGARYDPKLDRWRPMSVEGAPTALPGMQMIWTGVEAIVYGGFTPVISGIEGPEPGSESAADVVDSLHAYDPVHDRWRVIPLSEPLAPILAVWTGRTLILWGMNSAQTEPAGLMLFPSTGESKPLPVSNAPSVRTGAASVWTGDELLIWGGLSFSGELGDGAALSL